MIYFSGKEVLVGRRILFLPPDVTSRTVVHDPTLPDSRRHERTERYALHRLILASYGELVLEKTSGTYRRARQSTPPSGLSQLTHEQGADADRIELQQRWRRVAAELPRIHALVVPVDSGVDDFMQQAIEHALELRVAVLLIQSKNPIKIESRDRYANRQDLTYAIYANEREFRLIVANFMSEIVPTVTRWVVA